MIYCYLSVEYDKFNYEKTIIDMEGFAETVVPFFLGSHHEFKLS